MNWERAINAVTRTCLRTFEQTARPSGAAVVVYTRPADPDPIVVEIRSAVFDDNHVLVDPQTGALVVSRTPTLGVALADLPSGRWEEGDRVAVRAVDYRVIDCQNDSEGMAVLILHRADA